MTPSAWWLALSTLGLLAGTLLTWWLHRGQGLAIRVRPGAAAGGGGGPLISIIVPARNEARNIERCVSALLAQTYQNYEVIVLDDRSTDDTDAILRRLAAGNPRLRVLAGEALPAGWAGKPHALHQGVAAARGEWLCFVDADTFACPQALAATYATAQAYQADLFSILTCQTLGTFWEKVVMPVVLSGLAFGFPPERVNDPKRPDAVANGQFILIRRSVYDAVGGHQALRASLVEDKDLAQAVKRAGFRLVLADGQELAETRMYTSLAELWEGWTKNMFLGLRGRPWLLLFGAVSSLAGALALPAWLLASLLWLARGGGPAALVVVAEAAAVWALLLYARAMVARHLKISAWYAFSLPLGAGIFAAMMLTSTLRVLTGQKAWCGKVEYTLRRVHPCASASFQSPLLSCSLPPPACRSRPKPWPPRRRSVRACTWWATATRRSCTDADLFAAIDLGGAITFNCGAAPLAILFSFPKTITASASLNGGDLITLSGNNATPLFEVSGGTSLSLSHITISNGKDVGDGGAVFVDADASLIADHATFSNNKTDPAYSGGAIFSYGSLAISNSLFDSNQAGNGGAINPREPASKTTITNSQFTHNSATNATNAWGGALLVWDGAPVTVTNSQFISNTARWGGAAYIQHSGTPSAPTWLTLTSSLLTDNLADGGSDSVDGGGGAIYNNDHLVLIGTTLQDNLTVVPPGFGFTGIRAGGAIWNSSNGVVQMTGGALTGNRALHGGALYGFGNASITTATLADNLAGRGGAIENANNSGNTLTISATTLSDNQVSGALYPAITTPLGGAIFNTARLDVTNSTFSGNSGSPALQEDNSVITLTNVTLAENPDGGLSSDQSPNTSQVHLFNTLLAGNGTYNCGPIYFGTFTSNNSLSSNASCDPWSGADNLSGVDPHLGPLGNYLGPTFTHMPADGSPAVNAGASCPTVDQRGIHRPQGPACDIGAVERRANDGFFYLFLPLGRR